MNRLQTLRAGGKCRLPSFGINVIFDLDGVLWHGNQPIPGAAAAASRLIAAGHDVLFATNNSAAPLAEQEAKLASHGVDATGRVISSASAAGSMVREGDRVYVMGGAGIVEAIEAQGAVSVPLAAIDAGPPEVDAVIVGLDLELSYDRMRMAVAAIRNGARFIATNHDPTYPSEHGLLPGGGSIVAAVAVASETTPVYAGKPNQPMADLAIARLGPEGLMIGDRPDSDGAFARRAGYRFALVLSGVTTAAEAAKLDPPPAIIAADAVTLLASEFGV